MKKNLIFIFYKMLKMLKMLNLYNLNQSYILTKTFIKILIYNETQISKILLNSNIEIS